MLRPLYRPNRSTRALATRVRAQPIEVGCSGPVPSTLIAKASKVAVGSAAGIPDAHRHGPLAEDDAGVGFEVYVRAAFAEGSADAVLVHEDGVGRRGCPG